MKAKLSIELPFSFLPFAFPSMLPLFASASLPPIKALAWQTPFIGGGASFSLYFPKLSPDNEDFLVSLASYSGWFQRPEGFYYPSFIKEMPLGWERYESFLAFQKELNAFLFPYFVKAFPLAESLGEEGFLSSVLPYSQKYERKKAWLSLPQRKSAEDKDKGFCEEAVFSSWC